MDTAIVAKISRDQFLEWIEDYYHGRAGEGDIRTSFLNKFNIGHSDPDLMDTTLEREQDILDTIESRYVETF